MKDLTTSEIARQNVLNNKYALEEVQRVIGLRGIVFEEEIKFTKQQLASFFEVSERTINSCLTRNDQELRKNGYEVISNSSSGNALIISDVGTRFPEVDSGSTKATVCPLISSIELISSFAAFVINKER